AGRPSRDGAGGRAGKISSPWQGAHYLNLAAPGFGWHHRDLPGPPLPPPRATLAAPAQKKAAIARRSRVDAAIRVQKSARRHRDERGRGSLRRRAGAKNRSSKKSLACPHEGPSLAR